MRFADKTLEVIDALSAMKKEEEGNATIFSIFMLMLILLFTGAAVDIMRFEAVRTKMQSTMDRAVLAAADLDQEQEPGAVVQNYLERSGIPNSMTNVEVVQGLNYRTVTATGETDLDTFFLRMSGIDNLTAPALSIAEERISNVEISMVLDISGSMRWNSRIDNMRPAAKDFIEKVMTDESNGVTTLNLIPFAGHVNPGDIMFQYFRGKRPKLNENNGWGNGDQDAPGGSLCNNNAENAEEGSTDPSCTGDTTTTTTTTDPVTTASDDFFTPWDQAISNVVFYFDSNDDGSFDDRTDIAHKIEGFPEHAPRDADDFFKGAVAYLMAMDPDLTSPDQFLGASIKGGVKNKKYFQVKGNLNGPDSDLGPTKNKGRIPGFTYEYGWIDFAAWEPSYVAPATDDPNASTTGETSSSDGSTASDTQRVNMPSSCVEIYDEEFTNTNLPVSEDFVPHFHYHTHDEENVDWGWCPDDDSAIQYYSDDVEGLKTFIDNVRLHDGTGTQFGMKYALALLDPEMRGAISHLISEGLVADRFEGRPIDWHDQETEKFILLMSDGGVTNQYRPKNPHKPINGEVELSHQTGDVSETMSDYWNNRDNFFAQCNLAKELGVTVFVVAFETSSWAADDLRDCASSESHFFHVQGNEIEDAFDTVARQINNLRLIQ